MEMHHTTRRTTTHYLAYLTRILRARPRADVLCRVSAELWDAPSRPQDKKDGDARCFSKYRGL